MKFFLTKLVVAVALAVSTLWGGQQPVSAQAQDHAAIMEQMRAKEEHIGIWQRHPLVGIPLVSTPPTIDGTVESREWMSSARITRMIDYNKGLVVKDRTDMFLSYTPTHLYLAFQFERPDNSRVPTERDFVEILFDTEHQHLKYHDSAFTLDKTLWTGMGPSLDKKAWQPTTLEYKSRVTDFGWEGEISIPFKEFGMDAAPKAGTVWGADFLRNEKTPVDRLAIWSFRGKNWHKVSNMGHMLFTGKPVAIRAEGMGWIPEQQQAGVKVLVSNFGKEPVTLDTSMELRKAASPIQMEYYPRIDSAMAEELSAAIGATLKQEVTTALSQYPVAKEKTESVTVAPNSSKLIQLVQPDEPGKYLAGFAIKEGGTLLAGSLSPVEITVPLAIKTNSYLYSAKTVEYEVDLRRVMEKVTDNAQLLMEVKDPQGKIVAQNKQPINRDATEVGGIVQFEPTPDTLLTVNASILDGEKVVAQNLEHLRVPPAPPWLNNNIGKKKFVPEPFTPVKATQRELKASTSTYNWSNSFLPSFKVNNKEVLAAPITLSFKDASGADLPLRLSTWNLKSSDIEQAVYEFTGDLAGKAAVTGTVQVEFDGLSWYQLRIAPKSPMQLSASALDIALKKEFARLATAYGPEGGGMFSGRVPAEGLRFAFSHSFWLGNVEGGVQWFAENPKNWSNANPKDVIRISADDKVGNLKVNFIDKLTTLDKPIEWSFGFIPTPSRVKPKNWGDFAFFQSGYFSKDLTEPITPEAAANWEMRNRWNYYNSPAWERNRENVYAYIHHDSWQELMGYPGTYELKRQQALKNSAATLHKEGIKTLVYAGWGMNTEAPEWRDYGMEMVRLPLYNSGYGTYRQDNTTMWSDWYIYKVAEMIREFDIDGLFIDSAASPMISENYTPGMRWTDETGKVRGSFPIRANREWMKRLYKMFHGELKQDGVIYNHNSPPAIMAVESFTDVRCPSEYAQAHQGELDQEFIDMFMAKNSGEPFGLYSELTNKDWMGQWAAKKSPQVYAVALPLNISFKGLSSMYAQPYVEHGTYEIEYRPNQVNQMMPWIWEANRWVDKSTAEYLPWWKNAKYISTAPSDDRVIHALWLQKGQKALVCVSNLKTEARQIDVSLNLAELGMKNITVEDAVTGEAVPATGGKMSLKVDFERFKLLKVTAK